MNSSDTLTAVNTSGADGLLSRRVSSTSAFYTFDPSGNVAQRLNSSGSIVSSDTYDAFGSRVSTASSSDAFGFGGRWGYRTDAETGLVLCTHRYYDPSNGRWLTRDPIGYAGGVNLYSYCGNNPVSMADPTGLAYRSFGHDLTDSLSSSGGMLTWRDLGAAAASASWGLPGVFSAARGEN